MSRSISVLQQALQPVLKPIAWVYGAGMSVREMLYRRGLKPSWEPPVPTVSVGNIGWGGTGKTPVAGWLLGWAGRRGIETLLLTRGYKAKPVSYPYLVKPGALAEEAGDEPLMLATQHPKAHVVVDPKRIRGGRWGLEKFKPRFIVLDDGFQHMAVRRHLNLVLLRPEDLSGQWNKLIPAGSWRERASALGRASAFMIKASPSGFDRLRPYFKERLEAFRKPIFSFQVLPTGLRHVLSGKRQDDLEDARYLMVSGVGNPALVEYTAKNYLGYGPARHLRFRDHHAYTKSDVLEMMALSRRLGCKAILCTPKDAVKLGPMCNDEFWQFDLRVKFGPSSLGEDTPFDKWWIRRFDSLILRGPGGEKEGSDE